MSRFSEEVLEIVAFFKGVRKLTRIQKSMPELRLATPEVQKQLKRNRQTNKLFV